MRLLEKVVIMRKDRYKEEINTDLLQKKLWEQGDLDAFIEENHVHFVEGGLRDLLSKMIKERGLSIKDVISGTYIDDSYLYQIFRGVREPSRDKLIQIGIFLELSMIDMNRLLKVGRRTPLYVKNIRDVVIIHGINKGYSIEEIDSSLIEKSMATITD